VPGILWGFEPRAPPTLWGSRGATPHYLFLLPWGSLERQESSGDSSLGRNIKCWIADTADGPMLNLGCEMWKQDRIELIMIMWEPGYDRRAPKAD
jgi:hypothetical protein